MVTSATACGVCPSSIAGMTIISIQLRKTGIRCTRKSLKKYNESLAKKEYALLIPQEAAFGFGEEIPKSIIYGMLEELEENVGRWIEKINPDIKIDFKYSGKKDKSSEDSFEIIYSLDGVKDFEYEDLSGGQEFMVNLAFRLAISEIIQNDLGISVRLFCFDEVDERLDDATSDAFMLLSKNSKKQVEFWSYLTRNLSKINSITSSRLSKMTKINHHQPP